MIEDSAEIQKDAAAFVSKWRAKKNLPPVEPLYSAVDAERAVKQFVTFNYDRPMWVADGVTVTFRDAGHTLGASIMAGRSPVNIFGDPYEVKAQVASLDAFSGHADKNELVEYVNALTGNIKKIAVIHGEESQCLAFARTLGQMKPQAEVFAPVYRQAMEW